MAPHSSTFAWKIPWTEKPGRLQSMGSLESDTTERLHFDFSLSCIGEGNGNPLQCSCLENPRDGEAWWAAVYGVAQSRTRLKWLYSSSSSILWLFNNNFWGKQTTLNIYIGFKTLILCLVMSRLFATLWTVAQQVPLCMGFPRQEYWNGLPFPPKDLPDPGIDPHPALAGGFFTTVPSGKPPVILELLDCRMASLVVKMYVCVCVCACVCLCIYSYLSLYFCKYGWLYLGIVHTQYIGIFCIPRNSQFNDM